MPVTTIPLVEPHSAGQWALSSGDQIDVVFAGRRWGKTQAGVYRILQAATQVPDLYWWVGLSWKSASMKRAWRFLKYYSRKVLRGSGLDPKRHIHETNKEIRLPGAEIWLRTADNEDSLAGEGIAGAVIDEFSLMKETVWTEYLQATLLDNDGWAMFIGVPKGNNWAANLWRAAATRPRWRQWHFTTYDNPFIKRSSIDEVKGQLSERLFNQEYLAQVVSDSGSVFRRIMDAATATETEPAGADYVFGVDWGKHNDFTVISVIDIGNQRQVYMDRFNQIDYAIQVGRLKALAERYKPVTIIAESNAMGEPIIEQLVREGLPVQPFVTTNASKAAAIEALAMAFERSDIEILADPVQLAELQAYEMERLPSGMMRYNAPDGMHDDTVMALALAWHGATYKSNFKEWLTNELTG